VPAKVRLRTTLSMWSRDRCQSGT